jgi:hypothetical protein
MMRPQFPIETKSHALVFASEFGKNKLNTYKMLKYRDGWSHLGGQPAPRLNLQDAQPPVSLVLTPQTSQPPAPLLAFYLAVHTDTDA